jgi:hypothetical protein
MGIPSPATSTDGGGDFGAPVFILYLAALFLPHF